jgi:uncharacterized protein YodC (DUF2158 family)
MNEEMMAVDKPLGQTMPPSLRAGTVVKLRSDSPDMVVVGGDGDNIRCGFYNPADHDIQHCYIPLQALFIVCLAPVPNQTPVE